MLMQRGWGRWGRVLVGPFEGPGGWEARGQVPPHGGTSTILAIYDCTYTHDIDQQYACRDIQPMSESTKSHESWTKGE